MPESAETKVLRLESRLDNMDSSIFAKLDDIQQSITQLLTNQASMISEGHGYERRLQGHAERLQGVEQKFNEFQLEMSKDKGKAVVIAAIASLVGSSIVVTLVGLVFAQIFAQ